MANDSGRSPFQDDKDHERELEEAAFAFWLACEDQGVIGENVSWSQPKVAGFITKRKSSFSDKRCRALLGAGLRLALQVGRLVPCLLEPQVRPVSRHQPGHPSL